MAKNGQDGKSRRGQVKDRSQTYNPKTGQYIKRGEGGKFVSVKKTAGPYKGVRKEAGAKEAVKATKTAKSAQRKS